MLFFTLHAGWNFLSVCLVWISNRSSSPASVLISLPFWTFFLAPGGPTLPPPNPSFDLGALFLPVFWLKVRAVFNGALGCGEGRPWETLNGVPLLPMFCWKISCKKDTKIRQKPLDLFLDNFSQSYSHLNQAYLLCQILH